MKVVHLISGGDVGGAKTHVHSLIKSLNGSMTADLVCFSDGLFADEARELGISVHIFGGANLINVLKRLSGFITENGYEIIHCHGSRANMMGAMLRSRLRLPVVTTVHSDYKIDYLGRPLHRLVYGTINALSLRKLDYRICVSDMLSETLIRRGFDAETTFSIYNGIDFNVTADTKPRDEFFKDAGFGSDTIVFGIAARLDPVKDIRSLIRAFATAWAQNHNIRLAIAGEGPEEQGLRALAAELNVEKYVWFAGWVDDMHSFYNAIDVNTLTSLSETFPYALTEGARASLPTIASNVGGVPKLIQSGMTGFLFKPGDVEELTKHIIRLAGDAQLRAQMGERLYTTTKKRYSIEATVDKQSEIYSIILRRVNRVKKQRDGVMICGAYGKDNAGDDAILEAIISEIHSIDPDMPVTVLSRAPKDTSVSYRIGSIHTFNFPAFIHKMRKTQLYISGGGSLIQDVTSTRSLLYYLAGITLANQLGNKVQMYGCGVGPVSSTVNRKRAARVINRHVDAITLREDNSLETLKDMGVTEPVIRLAADPALTLLPDPDETVESRLIASGIPLDREYICFAVRTWAGFDEKAGEFAKAADYAYSRYGLLPVFMPVEPGRDIKAAGMVMSEMTAPCYLLEAPETGGAAMGLMKRMSALVSMRLHALVFAAGSGIPLIGVVYDPKVSSFLDYIGESRYIDLAEMDAPSLIVLIDDSLHAKVSENALVRLLELEKNNIEVARTLINERHGL